jgi:hypothetical protein
MPRIAIAGLVAGMLAFPAAPAVAGHQHLHCIETPNDKVHSVARGATFHASHTGFSQFHNNVHFGAFSSPGWQAQHDLAVVFPSGTPPTATCPADVPEQ